MSILEPGPGPFGDDARREIKASRALGCYAGAGGAWILELDPFRAVRESGLPEERARWTLVHLSADAKRATGKEARGEIVDADGEGQSRVGIAGTFDFDGDGVDEVLVEESSYWSIDGFHVETPRAYRATGGAVVPWDTLPGRRVIGWFDADEDGRPDLLLDTDAGTVALAHSLPGGSFATDDVVALSFLRAICSRPPSARPTGHPPPIPMPALPGAPPEDARETAAAKALCAPVRAIDAECPPSSTAP
jgi:hypothetical protein